MKKALKYLTKNMIQFLLINKYQIDKLKLCKITLFHVAGNICHYAYNQSLWAMSIILACINLNIMPTTE